MRDEPQDRRGKRESSAWQKRGQKAEKGNKAIGDKVIGWKRSARQTISTAFGPCMIPTWTRKRSVSVCREKRGTFALMICKYRS